MFSSLSSRGGSRLAFVRRAETLTRAATCVLALALGAVCAAAESAPPPTPSLNLTVNLINRLVQRGALTKEDAAELMQLAEADTARAKAAAAAAPAEADDTVRVTYVPEVVKAQLREEIKHEVMTQAREERWAAPRAFPEWVSRFTLFGDFRFRYEGDYFPRGNDNTGAFPNFNAINTGAPFDVSGTQFSPQYDVDQNRQRFRLRARFGAAVNLANNFSTGFRIGTGENNAPVTENQSLGAANSGQGGNFAKYAVWLDRAFLKYEVGGKPDRDLTVTVGRFDNPFFATNVLWADDLGFDGAVLKNSFALTDGLSPYLTVGAFPVFNTEFSFASNQPAKFASEDKWLYAAQLGAKLKAGEFEGNVAAALYYFKDVEGRLSAPYTPLTSQDAGNTDDTRPAFAQTGNTYMALRAITPNALNAFGTIDQFQYFGLATPFHELSLDGRLDYNHFDPFQISLIGEYVENIAYHRGAVRAKAVNNLGPTGSFAGGNQAWNVGLKVGAVALSRPGDWNASLSYRHVDSDAVMDGFADSDFGGTLLGTNHKGYVLGAGLAISPGVWIGVKWMSADAVAGPVFKNDLLLLDINASF